MSDNSKAKRCGSVAVIGMPNAGKSTLINTLIGQKVSIVSKRAQTTRCRVLGIMIHEDKSQIIFIDTPGVFDPKKDMDIAMVSSAYDALEEADCILHLINASEKAAVQKAKTIEDKFPKDKPVFLALNKIDKVRKPALLDLAKQLNNQFDYERTFMISGLKDQGLSHMLDILSDELPESVWHYDEDEITTMPMRMMAAEITREQIFHQLYRELPYAALVDTEAWEVFDNGDIHISQVIYIQSASQKAIVLGRGGSRIKQIGSKARQELEEMTGARVHLKLFVKVKENWPDDPENYQIMGL